MVLICPRCRRPAEGGSTTCELCLLDLIPDPSATAPAASAAASGSATAAGPGRAAVLEVAFPAGAVRVERGTHKQLGRLGEFRLLFAGHPNVSRMHAVLGLDDSGAAWVEPLPGPNGTWLDDVELEEGHRHPLCADQRLRLARDVEGRVLIHRAATPCPDTAPEGTGSP